MSTEEKAYKDSISRAKAVLNGPFGEQYKDAILQIFPGLAESEDERIRKGLIQYLENDRDYQPCQDVLFYKEALSWLEKQKEPADGDFARGYDCGYECCLHSHGAEWFEKQKEQKPKFYPGDVIKCTSSGSLWVRCKDRDNIRSDGHTACIGGGFELASEEEAVQFFQELNENGYQWDCIKGRPMKKEPKPAARSEEDEDKVDDICKLIEHATIIPRSGDDDTGIPPTRLNDKYKGELKAFVKSLRPQPNQEWSDEDVEKLAKIRASKSGTLASEMKFYRQGVRDAFNYKGLRPSWRPSEEQIIALCSAKEMPSARCFRSELYSLYDDLKKL